MNSDSQSIRQYYRIDNTKLRIGELRRVCRGKPISFFVSVMLKVLRIRLKVKTATSRIVRVCPIPVSDVPPSIWEILSPVVAACEREGAILQFTFTSEDLTDVEQWSVVLLGNENLVLWTLRYARNSGGTVLATTCTSKLNSGVFIVTSDYEQCFDYSPTIDREWMRDCSPDVLRMRHSERLAGVQSDAVAFMPDRLADFMATLSNQDLDEKLERGLYFPMSDAQVQALRASISTSKPLLQR